jgi:hypothetical protein
MPARRFRLRDTFIVLVPHLLRRVRRNDFRAFVHPPVAIVAAAQAQVASGSYQRGGLCGTWWAWSGWLSRLGWTLPDC